MSFVKELEEKMALERKKLLEAVLDYLHSVGAEAHLSEDPVQDVYGNTINEPVIRITGRNIDSIRVTSSDYFGCGMPETISRFHYEVSLGKKPDGEMAKQIDTRIEYKRDNNFDTISVNIINEHSKPGVSMHVNGWQPSRYIEYIYGPY